MPVQPIISENWTRFLLPIVRKEWFQKMTSIASPAIQFFDVQSSSNATEESQGVGDFGLVPEYNSSEALGAPAAIQFDQFSPLFPATFTHKEYAKGVSIERKMWDDDQRGMIRKRARLLGNSFGTTLAVHASSVFNNAFSSTRPGSDGQPLIADAHPNRPDDLATVYDNKGTTALDYAAVVATLAAAKRFKDDRGNPMPRSFDVLYVPVELEAKAYEITNAINKPGTADNDANFLGSQGLGVVVDPYLTDANNWFMLDRAEAKDHLSWWWRVRPDMTLDPTSDFNLVAKYRGYMRFIYGFDDWRWIYGHEVA
jgi:hypothetical protein